MSYLWQIFKNDDALFKDEEDIKKGFIILLVENMYGIKCSHGKFDNIIQNLKLYVVFTLEIPLLRIIGMQKRNDHKIFFIALFKIFKNYKKYLSIGELGN